MTRPKSSSPFYIAAGALHAFRRLIGLHPLRVGHLRSKIQCYFLHGLCHRDVSVRSGSTNLCGLQPWHLHGKSGRVLMRRLRNRKVCNVFSLAGMLSCSQTFRESYSLSIFGMVTFQLLSTHRESRREVINFRSLE